MALVAEAAAVLANMALAALEAGDERHGQDHYGHLDRLALFYIRQSSLAQVRNNTESTARQYALADEAVRLGWPGPRWR